MTRRLNTDQWRDHTEEPIIVWVYDGVWELAPVAVDDSHEADVYDEYTRAWYAAGAFMTFEEVCEEYSNDYSAAQIEELYMRGDFSAEAAGLPHEYYAEGCNDDGSDPIIYVDEETISQTRRESIIEAAHSLDTEEVAELYQTILEARKEYDA